MKKLVFIALFSFPLIFTAQFSDDQSSGDSENKWYTGGGIQLGFSNVSTVIGVSPLIGYNITDELSAGAGLNITYFKSGSFSSTLLGGRLFSRYLITPNIFARTEFHMTSVESNFAGREEEEASSEREWVPAWFVGGGYRQSIGNRTFLNVSIMWDVIEDENSPYTNPFISGGVTIGF